MEEIEVCARVKTINQICYVMIFDLVFFVLLLFKCDILSHGRRQSSSSSSHCDNCVSWKMQIAGRQNEMLSGKVGQGIHFVASATFIDEELPQSQSRPGLRVPSWLVTVTSWFGMGWYPPHIHIKPHLPFSCALFFPFHI